MLEGDSKTLWNYVDDDSFTAVTQKSEDIVNTKEHPIRSITFISEQNPISHFQENLLDDFETNIESHDDFWEIAIERTIKRKTYEKGYRTIQGVFFLYQNDVEDVWTALTISGRDFFEKGVRRYLESFTPELSISYLSTGEMRRLFESLNNTVEGRIIVEKAVVYSHEMESNISFEKKDFHEVFNEAENQDKYVDKLEFSIRGEQTFEGYITRHGDSRYIGGPSKIYYDILVEDLASLISNKGELFSNRAREYGSKESKPLEISFEERAIKDTEDNLQLIEALNNIKRSSLTVYHKNPYLHASVLDYTDGSSADVFITSDKNIAIVPSFNSSRAALMKLCDRITQEFQEGEVTDRRRQEKSFEDYFR